MPKKKPTRSARRGLRSTRAEPKARRTRLSSSKKTAPAETPPTATAPGNFSIVGIGASAGGLDALKRLFSRIPADVDMAFVIVSHLAPDHPSALAELLTNVTSLSVAEATDGAVIQINHIYVIPPNRDLSVLHGKLHVMERHQTAAHYLRPVDGFLTALAAGAGSRAIGVILSGSGLDGGYGIQAIKAEGGITFAQQQAQHDGMPQHAVATGDVDFILPPEEIADQLTQLAQQPQLHSHYATMERDALPGSADALNKIFLLLRNRTGNDFTYYKHSTLKRRIKRRMLLHKLDRVDDYVRYLQERPTELDALFQELLINVTCFFRDPDTFDALKQAVFPAITERRARDNPVRIWVPGCATGEEVYSIAMALVEYLGEYNSDVAIEIFGTDIDEAAIIKAREGLYPADIETHVSPERLGRFFTKAGTHYRISRSIRDICIFAVQNALKDPPFSRLDLVVCRNLFIYLEPVLQARLLQTFHYALRADRFLMLSTSETTGRTAELFTLVDKHAKIYARKSLTTALHVDMLQTNARWNVYEPMRTTPVAVKTTWNLQQQADDILLAKYRPAAVIVNEALEIVHFQGDTSPYLSPAPGAASFNLMRMARRELAVELRALVKEAVKQSGEARKDGVRLDQENAARTISVSVIPIKQPEAGARFFLVVFEQTETKTRRAPKQRAARGRAAHDQRIDELERELQGTREYLQSIIEEQESTNEELRSANEEVLSANEELQSTNEELETGKEELQSMNEELSTVNDELHSANTELARANDDLRNLLASVNIPIVMLARDQRIRHFTPATKEVMTLIPADIGRSISDIRFKVEMPPIEALLTEVCETCVSRTLEVSGSDGRRYTATIRPYRTADERIAGTVLIFNDITERHKRFEYERYVATNIRDAYDAITILGHDGRVQTWNRGAERLYGYSESEAIGMSFSQMVAEPDRPRAVESLMRVMRGEMIEPFQLQRVTKDGRMCEMLITLSRLSNEAGDGFIVATVESDMAERKS